jgi:hypothetical protein
MSPILPKKKYSYVIVEQSADLPSIEKHISELLENNENIFVLIPETFSDYELVEKKIKEKFWIKLTSEKVKTFVIPEVSSIFFSENTSIQIKKYSND